MSHREELTDIIETRIRLTGNPREAADAILAAGYRKPRTITTAEELDALPVGSVIMDALLDPLHKAYGAGTRTFWCYGEVQVMDPNFPAVVLKEGGADE